MAKEAICALLADDDPSGQRTTYEQVMAIAGDDLEHLITCETGREIQEHLADTRLRLLLLDWSLADGECPIDSILATLRDRSHATAIILITGHTEDDLLHSAPTLTQTNGDVHVAILEKPLSLDRLSRRLRTAIAHIRGEELPDDAFDEVRPSGDEIVPPLTRPLSEFGELDALRPHLPPRAELVTSPDRFDDLCGLVTDHLDQFLTGPAMNSYHIFYSQWGPLFTNYGGIDHRPCLFGILREQFPAAKMVLDSCVHEVNNILGRYFNSLDPPRVDEWSALKTEIRPFLHRAYMAFEAYGREKDETAFWEYRDVAEVVSSIENRYSFVQCDIPQKSTFVHLPVGTLEGTLRTFMTNFEKVRQATEQTDAELNLMVFVEGDEVVFRVMDNLEPLCREQLEGLFDRTLPSEHGYGEGTGFLRMREWVEILGGRVTSYHERKGAWYQKSPGSVPEEIPADHEVVTCLTQQGMTKGFEFRLPIAA